MKLDVVSIGTRMPTWLAQGWDEYAKRMPPHLPLNLIEVEQAKPQVPKSAAVEGQRLIQKCSPRAKQVALQGGQKAWSTEQLRNAMVQWLNEGDPVCFLIGGADGLDPQVVSQCHQVWSLGPAVYPHMLVRVIVAEQLYRAWTMIQGHPYHRGNDE